MNDPDTEDRGLEDYLAGGSELSEAYRRLGREEPEGHLDQSILSAARHDVDVEHQVAHSPFSRNWVVPASLAAVLAAFPEARTEAASRRLRTRGVRRLTG